MRPYAGLALAASVAAAATLGAQQRRDSLVAAAGAEFDAARRVQILVPALDPALGAPDTSWDIAVQLLAQTLMEEGQETTAAAWLRWALRQAPELEPDTVRFLPRVIAAFRAAQDLVTRTTSPDDTLARTTWHWPATAAAYTAAAGSLRVTAATAAALTSVIVIGVGPVQPGTAVPLAPGSYAIRVRAGDDSVQVTREALPGVTTMVDFRLRRPVVVAAPPPAAPSQPPTEPALEEQHGKGFPWLWVALGAAGAGAAVALLAGGHSNNTTTGAGTGGITITFPNP